MVIFSQTLVKGSVTMATVKVPPGDQILQKKMCRKLILKSQSSTV